ncbi:PilZ domain protein [compost metagenome]
MEINSKRQTIVGPIEDISAQGCRVTYKLDRQLMKLNDYVTGQLLVGTNAPIEIQGQIRHIKVDETNVQLFSYGIEFVSLPPIVENKLFSLTLEIHKQIFRP